MNSIPIPTEPGQRSECPEAGRPNLPPQPQCWSLRLMLTHGEHMKARTLLDALNRIQRAFGHPDYDMPEPIRTDLPDLVTCPAVQIVEVEHLGPGRIAA